MYLSRLYLRCFRSIKELDLQFQKGKNVIVGKNNSGKSNIVQALGLILGESSPTYSKSDSISEDDFYCSKDKDGQSSIAKELFIWCELRRDKGEAINYDELYKCFGFYVLSKTIPNSEGGKPLKEPARIPARFLPHNCEPIFNIDEDNATKEYVNNKLRNHKILEKQFEDKHHFAYAFRATNTPETGIVKEIRFLYRENEQSDWVMAFKASIRTELLQSAIIPTFRDPASQLRATNWTWYGKLMQHLLHSHKKSVKLESALKQLRTVADEIFSGVKAQIETTSLEIAFPGTEVFFQFNTDSGHELYKNCVIYVDDGFKSRLEDKGSGIQSATIIGLFKYYVQKVAVKASALLCVEEPELFLHPHARRVISDKLDEFLGDSKNQVVITTHSSEFIRTSGPSANIIMVRKGIEGSLAVPISITDFKGLLIDNNQNELFFADKVIITEGHDNFILQLVAKECFPGKLDEQNVSIISVWGKDRVAKFSKLILRLGIKAFVFMDFDYLLRDHLDDRKKYKDAKSHDSIVNLPQEFFSQSCILAEKAEKGYAYFQKLRADIKAQNEEGFYTAKTAKELNSVDVDKLLPKLRSKGIGILSGEIEDIAIDPKLMSRSNKFDLDKIYTINRHLDEGTKLASLIDYAEIKEFLASVFKS